VSTLVLVRHGQASFFDSDYDRLSDLGRRQARILAEYWLRTGTTFDAAYTGPLERQSETAREVFDRLRGSEADLPEPQVLREWSEYDLSAVTSTWLREIAELEPGPVDLADIKPEDQAELAKQFQRAFEVMMREWVTGEREVVGAETWPQFKDRVHRGLETVVTAHPRGARVVVFSSGGAIAVALQRVLGVSDLTALELNWTIRNCSITEVLYSRGRMNLSSFNGVPHLEGALVTYR
jgi:broad specificity phosphatase PhoE